MMNAVGATTSYKILPESTWAMATVFNNWAATKFKFGDIGPR